MCATLALLWSALGVARAEATSPYTLAQTYGAALRMLRVDLGLEVLERDPDAAYLLFKYRLSDNPRREVDAAIELVSVDDRVRVIIKIPQMPASHERLIRDRLVKKLRDDYGEPPKRPEPPRPSEPSKPPDPAPAPDGTPEKPAKP